MPVVDDDDSLLGSYLEDIRRYATLTATEEQELLVLARLGDREAHRRVSQGYLGATASIAIEVALPWMRPLDAIQEANIVLFRLVDDEDVHLVRDRLRGAIEQRFNEIPPP